MTQLTTGPQSVATGEAESTLSWSPDGKTIAFTLVPNAILNDQSYSRIALVDVATHNRSHARPERRAWEGDPLFSPDGTRIAYSCAKGDPQVNLQQLCVTTPAGGAGRPISAPLDRPIAQRRVVARFERASAVAVRIARRSHSTVCRCDGAPDRLDHERAESSLGTARTRSPPTARSSSWLHRRSSPPSCSCALRRRDDSQAYRLQRMRSRPRSRACASASRFRPRRASPVTAFSTFRRALHCGQEISARRLHSRRPDRLVDALVQLLVAGDGGARLARTAAELSRQRRSRAGLSALRALRPEDGPGKDIMAAIDAVRARGIVDSSRIAVGGWSYGGIMTAWMISKYHIWRAAVSGASVERLDYRLRHRRR